MDRLLEMYHRHERERALPAPIEAAWLHHRFVQIHPFEDGNGRVARLLMSFVFAKRGEPSPIISAEEKPEYFIALQAADRGDARRFVRMLQIRSLAALEFASDSAEAVLAGGTRYYHTNGDLSSKDESQRWSRKQSRHSRDGEGEPSPVNEVEGETPDGDRNTAEQACTHPRGANAAPRPRGARTRAGRARGALDIA